ncbi:hypothetical protein QE152_g25796 [Popillia japonica]|uniref:Uncharacterized protein n=1 Tax=Popillia japonica TaxID=7064 RepID=A0AAW1K1N3_POPJA
MILGKAMAYQDSVLQEAEPTGSTTEQHLTKLAFRYLYAPGLHNKSSPIFCEKLGLWIYDLLPLNHVRALYIRIVWENTLKYEKCHGQIESVCPAYHRRQSPTSPKKSGCHYGDKTRASCQK